MTPKPQKSHPAHPMTRLSALLFALICLAGIPHARAAQPATYKPTAIAPDTGWTCSSVYGINNLGQVSGHFYNRDGDTGNAIERQAFIWDKTSGATQLPTLSGQTKTWSINDNSFVAGISWNTEGHQRAVRWDTVGGTMVDIGALTNTTPEPDLTGDTSFSFEINNQNQVVGNADIPNDDESFIPFHAFLYDTSDGIQDLGTFTTAYPQWQNGYSIAYGITNSGIVVGCAHDGTWTLLPFVWNASDGMQELNRNPSYSGATQEWYAAVINESGLIGGHVIAADNQSLPHYWPDAGADPLQISMPADFPYGEIYGINAQGQMVGIMWDNDQAEASEHAFVYDAQNGVRDLNDLIPAGSGWVLETARDINDAGQISGWGTLNGQERGFILTPASGFNPAVNMLLLDDDDQQTE